MTITVERSGRRSSAVGGLVSGLGPSSILLCLMNVDSLKVWKRLTKLSKSSGIYTHFDNLVRR